MASASSAPPRRAVPLTMTAWTKFEIPACSSDSQRVPIRTISETATTGRQRVLADEHQ